MKQTRGIRNHNPGNIRRSKDPWQGLAKEQNDAEFFQFESAAFGIRALAKTLITYQDKYGLNQPATIIGRWAPSNENNTDAYVRSVCERTGFEPMKELDLQSFDHLRGLVEAIIHHENGQQPYSAVVIEEGLRRAGVVKAQPSIVKDKAVALTTIGTASAVAAQVATNVSEVWGALAGIHPILPHAIVIGLAGVGVLALAYFLVDRIVRRSRGLA